MFFVLKYILIDLYILQTSPFSYYLLRINPLVRVFAVYVQGTEFEDGGLRDTSRETVAQTREGWLGERV